VLAGIATKEEIERTWTLIDIVIANEVLDVKQEIEFRDNEKLRERTRV
jgi:hypothetical protein